MTLLGEVSTSEFAVLKRSAVFRAIVRFVSASILLTVSSISSVFSTVTAFVRKAIFLRLDLIPLIRAENLSATHATFLTAILA